MYICIYIYISWHLITLHFLLQWEIISSPAPDRRIPNIMRGGQMSLRKWVTLGSRMWPLDLGSCQHVPGHRPGQAPSRTSSHPWVSSNQFSFRMADGIFSSTKATHVHFIPSNHRKTPPEINILHFRSIQRCQMALLRCQIFSKLLFLLFALLGEFTLFFLALLGKQIRRFWEKSLVFVPLLLQGDLLPTIQWLCQPCHIAKLTVTRGGATCYAFLHQL